MSRNDTIGSHKTTVATDASGTLNVTYHRTIVWARRRDGSVILNTGGYRTRTTKLRMNQAFTQFGMHYRVYQLKGQWWVGSPTKDYKFEAEMMTIYADGSSVQGTGACLYEEIGS